MDRRIFSDCRNKLCQAWVMQSDLSLPEGQVFNHAVLLSQPARYEMNDAESHYQALREMMQEIALAGLYRGGFFRFQALAKRMV